MAKRKRGPLAREGQDNPSEYENKTAATLNIKSFKDVADSEDEFHEGRDKIMLEDQPKSKKRKQLEEEDAFLEASDEDILGHTVDDSDSDNSIGDEDIEDPEDEMAAEDLNAEQEDDAVSEDSETDWGASKSAYYNADEITNEEEAAEEAAEARRLQQKRLQSLTEADFGFDADEWADQASEDGEDGETDGTIVEKLPELHITPDMTSDEKTAILKKRYPDFERFAKNLIDLQPTWNALKADLKNMQADATATGSSAAAVSGVLATKVRALSAYLGALSLYFAVLTSTADRFAEYSKTDSDLKTSTILPLAPMDLRDHGIMDSILEAQANWERVQDLEMEGESEEARSIDEDYEEAVVHDAPVQHDEEAVASRPKPKSAAEARREARIAATEANLRDLDRQLAANARSARGAGAQRTAMAGPDQDYGDEAPLTAEQAAEKAQKRKSLRFYTSQLAQRQIKRSGAAARAQQGDDDLPYRERWRDRMERLNKEAEARGRKAQAQEDEDDYEDDPRQETNAERSANGAGSDDDYAQLVSAASRKKAQKQQRELAYQQAKASNGAMRVVREPVAESEDGRREIGYTIAANKGLTPNRKKANKNPRVKKRKKFEDKNKKLRTMKPTFKGGEGRGGYGGELTGIKKSNVRSVKF